MHSSSRGKGEAVLFIHGMPTNGRLWDGVVGKLSRQYRCIVVDLPGMGGTPFLPYGPSYFTQVSAQIETVRRRYRVQRWRVVGHDAGAAVAVQYAHLFPQRVECLALLSPAIFPDLRPFFLLEMLRKPVLGELSAPLVNTVFWHFVMRRAIPGPHLAPQRSSFAKTFSGFIGPWKLMRLVRWGKPEIVLEKFPSILESLECPTLVINGTLDVLPESFARRATALIPNARFIALHSGHFIPLERAVQVAEQLATFFRSYGAEQLEDSAFAAAAQTIRGHAESGNALPASNLVPHPAA
jgi:pimeloyl-ACP methyl ester carboxylesterase